MNKTELKKFAVDARRDLMAKVSLKAEQYGITKANQELKIVENYGQLFINDNSYPIERKHAFHTLQQRLKTAGYDQLIEEVAYTWFNRIIAIRYMEVNNYLPDRVNVLSSNTGKNEPDILLQYETMNLDVDPKQIGEWLQKGESEQAYRKLLVAQCNSLNKLLPFLFEKIDNFTELLLPDYLLDQESIVRKIVNDLSDENFFQLDEDGSRSDNVEVLGWLYQYYMSEKKEQVGGLKNNAVKKEDLPVVTQLFTPKWIVQYMVQNSLGKLYDEKYEDNQLAQNWEYYLKHEENHHLYPEFESLEDLKIMDPACGSGHILIYAFDMLFDMYEEAGYPSREIPQLILEKNLYGLDIDKRAQQIANFALLMKAAEKQPRFISRLSRKGQSPKLNVFEIVDADQSLSEEAIDYFAENETEKSLINELLSQFENGKQFGSLINPIEVPYEEWIVRLYSLEDQKGDLLDESYFQELKVKLLPVFEQALLLYQKYDVVITNPPYHNKYNSVLKKFINTKYKNNKADLFSAFIQKAKNQTKNFGYAALMTPYTWMFLSSHEKLREFILKNSTITSFVQLEYSAFEEATVPICTFVVQNQTQQPVGDFVRLAEFKGAKLQPIKLKDAVGDSTVSYRYISDSSTFSDIPGSPIAFWASAKIRSLFRENKMLGDVAETRVGVSTGENNKYVRFWYEVDINKVGLGLNRNSVETSKYKWFPYNKGGSFRKWYGNQLELVNWANNGKSIRENGRGVIRNPNYYFREGITWSDITSGSFSARYSPQGFIFGTVGLMLFTDHNLKFILGYMNSKVFALFAKFTMSTMHFNPREVAQQPFIEDKQSNHITQMVDENISVSKLDWDSFETSWFYNKHPLITYNENSGYLIDSFVNWNEETKKRYIQIKENEEKINRYFIDLFNLEDELSSDVKMKEITIALADRERESKSLLSYFIGCIVGRYSLYYEGLAYAGGNYDESKFKTFKPNPDGLIQLTDDHYFDNDIIVRLREFLSVAFNPDTVDENMQWLADSLGMKKNESPEECLRRYFLDEFFNNHCKTYQKRPIYWLVDSGKHKGLRTLIYMHRYRPDTMAVIRFEHLQEIQSKYQNEIDMIDTRLANPSLTPADKRSLEKSKTEFQKKIEELQKFDKKLATYANEQIEIDLDDGIKVNYAKFDKVLAKIK